MPSQPRKAVMPGPSSKFQTVRSVKIKMNGFEGNVATVQER